MKSIRKTYLSIIMRQNKCNLEMPNDVKIMLNKNFEEFKEKSQALLLFPSPDLAYKNSVMEMSKE